MIAGWQLNFLDPESRHSKVRCSRSTVQTSHRYMQQSKEDSKSVAKLSKVAERIKTFRHSHWEIVVFAFHKLHCLLLKNSIYSLFR